jgi:hypothetical protein
MCVQAQRRDHPEPVQTGHRNITNDQVRLVFQRRQNPLLAIFGSECLVAFETEDFEKAGLQAFIIVNDQHFFH